MALKKAINTPYGIDLPEAYIRIESFTGSKQIMYLTVLSYASAQAAIDRLDPVGKIKHPFIPDISEGAVNFIGQGYEHLKTLPEFEGAVDC